MKIPNMANMTEPLEAFKELLDKFDQEPKPISERDASKAIYSIRDPKDLSETITQWVAEAMALNV
jgi:hypothetical protein